MVVVKDETPYANIELVLMEFLKTFGETDTVVPPDGVKGIQINRMAGEPDDGLTDYPRVRVLVYDDDYVEAQRTAEKIRQRIYTLDNGGHIVMPPEADVDLAGKTVLFDTARGDVPPENEAYPNPERVQVSGYYAFSLRRPN
ncbi:hypothetical protein [Nocardia phage NBR1]|uniref:hypothetical protein n=1 Tax=Nocardia phage NBR1 TaxID=1109711 RepID=UPI00023EED9F|nr:hypothetical protein NoPhNBR1_gp13 [Nocardia phage NBR1]AEV52226.1 hypothetical protein [Nocardia phage NBR1]